jgi:phospholipid/cholesterol/gamma-HCH transport system substrate-binding protein
MASRLLREGSVGLLLVAGLGVLAGGIAWIRGFDPTNRSYTVWVNFPATVGIQTGSTVNYRGVKVGRVKEMIPESGGVKVKLGISPANLVIPLDSTFTIDQVSLLGESVLNITPTREAKAITTAAKPLDGNCDRAQILCDGSTLKGMDGVNTDSLIRSMMQLTNAYANPAFTGQIMTLTANSSRAAAEIATVSKEFSGLARSLRSDLTGSAGTAQNLNQAVQSIGGAADSIRDSARGFGTVANRAGTTTEQATLALTQINGLLAANRTNLVSTLDNLNATSGTLRVSMANLAPTLDRLQNGQIVQNLEVLSKNAAVASTNLKDVSQALNSPANLTLLQQTLESARSTFANVQKITADMDELTGDPKVREGLRNMIKGLGNLVSTTQQLQQQAQYAQVLPALQAQVEEQSTAQPLGPEAAPPASPNGQVQPVQPILPPHMSLLPANPQRP